MSTNSLVNTLIAIGNKPGSTRRDLLTISYRIVRQLWELPHHPCRAPRSAPKGPQLHQLGPFPQRRADVLEQQADEYLAEELACVIDVLKDYGHVLALDREGYAKALGFEALADRGSTGPYGSAASEPHCPYYLTVDNEQVHKSAAIRHEHHKTLLNCPRSQANHPR